MIFLPSYYLFLSSLFIAQSPNRNFVLVESNGYASVWIDKHVDKTATAHSRGEKVPVSHGGEKIRNRIAFNDGTRILTTYNTRITSEVRGKLILVRPDLTEVVATDSEQVEACTVKIQNMTSMISKLHALSIRL
jgi:hypothetical protein